MICLKLRIDFEWLIWTPKRGKYAGKTKFVCSTVNPDYIFGITAIIAGWKRNSEEMNMHLASVTPYQFQKNTTLLKDERIIEILNKKFSEYQIIWEKRRLVNTAKRFLMK